MEHYLFFRKKGMAAERIECQHDPGCGRICVRARCVGRGSLSDDRKKDSVPEVFAFIGFAKSFEKAGFQVVARPSETRLIMRLTK